MEVIVQTLLQLQKAKKPRNRLAALQQALYVGRRDAQEESRPIKHANLSKIGSSILLEAVFRQVRTAILLQPIADYYQIVADVCRINLDLASEIQYIRYARHVHPTDRALTKRLAAALVKNGLEIMVTAANHSHDVALYIKAASNFKESVSLNRESSKIYAYLAMCHIRLNEFDDALDVMDKAVAFDTRRLENNPDCEEVEEGVSGSPSPSYSSIDIYLLRAKVLQAKGSVERCIADMRVATSLDPNHPEVVAFNSRTLLLAERYYQRGMESFSKDDYQEAIQSVQDALVISPEDLKLLIMLARLYRVSDNASKAYEYIQRASNVFVALSENMIPIPYDLEHQKNLVVNDFALSQAENGDYLQAIALLNQVITSEEGLKVHYDQTVSFQFYLNRGDCHRQLEDYKCAIADYNMAASLQPNNWEIKTRLSMANYSAAVAYFNEGYYKDSEGLLDDAIRLNFKIFEYFLLRGRSRYYQGDFEGARSDYLAAYRLNPNGVEVQRYYFQFHTGSTNDVNGLQVSSSIQSSLTLIPPKQDIPFNIHMKPAVSKIKDECSRERGVAIPSTPSILQPQDQLQLLRTLPSLHTRLYNSSSLPSRKARSNEQAPKGPTTFDSRNQERSSWQGKKGVYTSAFKLKEESKRRTQLSLRRPDALLVGVASLPQKRF